MKSEMYKKGIKRRKVLGDDYVDRAETLLMISEDLQIL